MKLPEFKLNASTRWDMHRAFYMNHGSTSEYGAPFIQFETGELIATHYATDHGKRDHYPDLNLLIVSTDDPDCPTLLMPGGEPIPQTWLVHGGLQVLLIDLDTGRAVRVSGYINDQRVPARFWGRCTAYFGGEGFDAVARPIAVAKPYKLDPDEKAHAEELVCACKAWAVLATEAMKNLNKNSIRWDTAYQLEDLMAMTFNTMDPYQRLRLVTKGYKKPRPSVDYPYLMVK